MISKQNMLSETAIKNNNCLFNTYMYMHLDILQLYQSIFYNYLIFV